MPQSSVKLCIFFGVWRNRGFNGAKAEVGGEGGVNYTKRLQRLVLSASAPGRVRGSRGTGARRCPIIMARYQRGALVGHDGSCHG